MDEQAQFDHHRRTLRGGRAAIYDPTMGPGEEQLQTFLRWWFVEKGRDLERLLISVLCYKAAMSAFSTVDQPMENFLLLTTDGVKIRAMRKTIAESREVLAEMTRTLHLDSMSYIGMNLVSLSGNFRDTLIQNEVSFPALQSYGQGGARGLYELQKRHGLSAVVEDDDEVENGGADAQHGGYVSGPDPVGQRSLSIRQGEGAAASQSPRKSEDLFKDESAREANVTHVLEGWYVPELPPPSPQKQPIDLTHGGDEESDRHQTSPTPKPKNPKRNTVEPGARAASESVRTDKGTKRSIAVSEGGNLEPPAKKPFLGDMTFPF